MTPPAIITQTDCGGPLHRRILNTILPTAKTKTATYVAIETSHIRGQPRLRFMVHPGNSAQFTIQRRPDGTISARTADPRTPPTLLHTHRALVDKLTNDHRRLLARLCLQDTHTRTLIFHALNDRQHSSDLHKLLHRLSIHLTSLSLKESECYGKRQPLSLKRLDQTWRHFLYRDLIDRKVFNLACALTTGYSSPTHREYNFALVNPDTAHRVAYQPRSLPADLIKHYVHHLFDLDSTHPVDIDLIVQEAQAHLDAPGVEPSPQQPDEDPDIQDLTAFVAQEGLRTASTSLTRLKPLELVTKDGRLTLKSLPRPGGHSLQSVTRHSDGTLSVTHKGHSRPGTTPLFDPAETRRAAKDYAAAETLKAAVQRLGHRGLAKTLADPSLTSSLTKLLREISAAAFRYAPAAQGTIPHHKATSRLNSILKTRIVDPRITALTNSVYRHRNPPSTPRTSTSAAPSITTKSP